MTLEPQQAILLASDELDQPLKHMADVYSLPTQALLRDVLLNYKLEYSKLDAVTHRIEAVLKSARLQRIRRVVLEMDMETKAVRRLTVEREFASGRTSTLRFTLVDSRTADESFFRPQGHLRADTQMLDRSSYSDWRSEILQNRFGSTAWGWLRVTTEDPALEE